MINEESLNASQQEYKDFILSHIWSDMTTEFSNWIDSLRSEMESEDDLEEIRKDQGRISALREVLDFPIQVISAYQARDYIDSVEEGEI